MLRLQRVRARLLGRNAALKREARRAPDSRVLAELLPARMAARRSAGADVEASARAVRFAAVSPPYARERACTSEPNAARVVIGSIAWSVPHDRRSPGALADRMINEGWLPLDDILDTREVVGGGVMIDVGANIGTTAILRVVLGDAQVAYAAEPDAANFACLVRNVIDNGLEGRVCPDQVAIGAFDGPTRLRTTTSIGGHHLLPDSSGDVPVACVRLDTWLRRLEVDARDVRFVKIDTQGWEGHVLAGAGELLDCAHIAWALEIAPAMLERASTAPGALYASLASRFGYFIDIRATSGARVQPAAQLPDALAYLANGSSTYTNIVLFGNPAAVANDGRP